MSHVATQIREAFVSALSALPNTTVLQQWPDAVEITQTQRAVNLVRETETVETVYTMGDCRQTRTLLWQVECFATSDVSVLENFLVDVEHAIAGVTLANVKTRLTAVDIEAETNKRRVFAGVLTYEAVYNTVPGDVETAI